MGLRKHLGSDYNLIFQTLVVEVQIHRQSDPPGPTPVLRPLPEAQRTIRIKDLPGLVRVVEPGGELQGQGVLSMVNQANSGQAAAESTAELWYLLQRGAPVAAAAAAPPSVI